MGWGEVLIPETSYPSHIGQRDTDIGRWKLRWIGLKLRRLRRCGEGVHSIFQAAFQVLDDGEQTGEV